MCAKCARRIGNPQKPQKCSQVHTKIAPDQFAQYVARATKFPTGLWRERSVSEREIFYAVFACQRTLEHYRNIPELSSLAMTDPTATRRRGGTMEVAPQRTITKSRRSGYDPKADIGTKRISLRKLHELSMRECTHLHTCFVMQGKAVDNIGASLIIPDNFYVASITP